MFRTRQDARTRKDWDIPKDSPHALGCGRKLAQQPCRADALFETWPKIPALNNRGGHTF